MAPTIRGHNLLIVEDSIGDARLITEFLKDTDFKNHEITYIRTLDEVEAFVRTNFQAILLDLHLSHSRPVATFKKMNTLFPRIPIIVMTGLKDDGLAGRIVRMGAQDYLIKGTFDFDILQRSLKYAIFRKKAERRLASEKVKSQNLQTKADSFEIKNLYLAELNKTKDLFLSVASHQLRTPATAVKQYIGLMLEGYAGDLKPQQTDFLKTAYESNERQLRIINELLNIARLDSGQVRLHKSPIDIAELIESVINDQRAALSLKNQTIQFDHDSDQTNLAIDRDNMRMVFDNLLDNAIKYSPNDTAIEIQVSAAANQVVCSFTDHGIGISKANQSKLFQKFFRVTDSFTHSPDGSGLGLYWAKEIVKLHGGDIKLDSVPGEGSTFQVCLPAL